MGISRHINETNGLITFAPEGRLQIEEIREALRDAMSDPLFRSGADVLWDLRQVDPIAPTAQEVRDLVAHVGGLQPERGRGYKVAVVASRDLDFGIARMYGMYADSLPFEVQVFRSMSEAGRWLQSELPNAG